MVETIYVTNDKTKEGYMIINKDDYNPDEHGKPLTKAQVTAIQKKQVEV